MTNVCPSSVTSAASVPTTYLGGSDADPTFPSTVGAYTLPTNNPTFTVSAGNGSDTQVTKTAHLFNVLDTFVVTAVSGRYTPPTSGYWASTQSQSLATLNQIQPIYTSFTTTNVPGQTYLIINPSAALKNTITGNTADATNSVSYDLLYSLQYEFCFWVKV